MLQPPLLHRCRPRDLPRQLPPTLIFVRSAELKCRQEHISVRNAEGRCRKFRATGNRPYRKRYCRTYPVSTDNRPMATAFPYSNPNSFHLFVTLAFVASSMRISSGQGRVKPSVGHLRVASTPIFDP